MYLRTLLILIVLGAVAIFAAINWKAFMAPTTLSVVFATVEAPLGLILLAVVGLLTLLFLLYVVYLQSSILWKTGAMRANYKRSGNSPSKRKLLVSANCARFWKASWEGSGKKPRNQRWPCWRNLKGLNGSCARWWSSPEIRLPLTSGRLRIGLNVLQAGGFQRTLCE